MALYAIGDLHLSLGSEKPMDVFGGRWDNYVEKIVEGFSALTDDDTCIICGDISWAMSMEEAVSDFKFISDLPGKKIILKGNHDYWWSTANKAYSCFAANGIENIDILHNNCFFYEDYAICGTRGWFYEEEKSPEHDKKIMAREIMRLEASLKAAGDKRKLVFLHYPPIYHKYECPEILSLLREYKAERCCYGHLHSKSCHLAFTGVRDGTQFSLVSADFVNFSPIKLI